MSGSLPATFFGRLATGSGPSGLGDVQAKKEGYKLAGPLRVARALYEQQTSRKVAVSGRLLALDQKRE